MKTLTPTERRALKAKAHALDPVVIIGHHGLTPAVLQEIDVNLRAHELIKVRVANDDRDERDALLVQIGEALAAAPVQHLGKVLTLWRPAPPKEEKAPGPKARAPKSKPRAPKSKAHASGPKARAKAPPKSRSEAALPRAKTAPKPRSMAGSPRAKLPGPRGQAPSPRSPAPAPRRRRRQAQA